MGFFSKDPFSNIPIKIKLPLGFVLLYLCVMGVGGYFVIDSVYTPLNREILLRLKSEAVTLATLFDRHLESLSLRAEDFASDGFIRDQTELLIRTKVSGDPSQDELMGRLREHLRVNKLPIVPEFIDLHIYDLNKVKLLGVNTAEPDIRSIITVDFNSEKTQVSAILPSDNVNGFPTAAIITPLFNRRRDRHIGYLVCLFNLAQVIEQTSIKYDDAIPESYTEKYLTFVDQRGLIMEIPWWYLKAARNQSTASLRSERTGIKFSRGQSGAVLAAQTGRYTSQPGEEVFRQTFPLRSAGWYSIIELNATSALNPLAVLEGRFLGIACILAIPILILLFFAIQHVIRPLGELEKMAARIKEGDFSARNTIDAGDEIGTLARTSNLMAAAIEERTESLEKSAADLQKRERELRIQHNLMDTVIHSMTDGLLFMNFQGHVLLSNKAAEPLLGIINRTDEHLLIQKCEYHREEMDECIMCMTDPNRHTSCMLTVNNIIYEILSTKVPTLHGTSKVLVARNITEREVMHRQQAHQERLAVLGKIAAVVAHEINNPLAAISMYNQMMETELPAASPFHEHVDVIRRNTETCQHIIRDLLDYAGTPRPRIREIHLHDLLVDVVQFLRPLHKKQTIAIEQDFQARNPICMGDATHLRQVFVNLLVNALQAIEDSPQQAAENLRLRGTLVCDEGNIVPRSLTPQQATGLPKAIARFTAMHALAKSVQEEQGMIRLRTHEREDGAILMVDVEDDGPGIDARHAPEIFEPFFTTKSSGGTGLGLSTSRRIIEAHEGTLELLESRPGRTVFRVSLPRAASTASLMQIETMDNHDPIR